MALQYFADVTCLPDSRFLGKDLDILKKYQKDRPCYIDEQ